MATQFSTIAGLKRAATKIRRETDMTHAQALDHVARAGGFQNFMDASRKIDKAKPRPVFNLEVSQYWFDRKTQTHGVERLSMQVSTPLLDLVKPHNLKGYLDGVTLQGAGGLCGYGKGENQDHASKLACRLARAVQFMDATGLKPSTGKRFYPKGDWHNRPPGVDHDQGWYDPRTRTSLFTDEPYELGQETQSERAIWCKRHGFEICRSKWGSVYGYGTELYLIAKREIALDLKALLARLEAAPPPISAKVMSFK